MGRGAPKPPATARVTRSMAAAGVVDEHEGTKAEDVEEPSKPPTRTPRARRSEETAPASPKPKEAPKADAAADRELSTSITVASVSSNKPGLDLALDPTPNPAVSGRRRPRAFDFYDTADSPGAAKSPGPRPATPKSLADQHDPSDLPPNTPKIPWELYGITDADESAQPASQYRPSPSSSARKGPPEPIITNSSPRTGLSIDRGSVSPAQPPPAAPPPRRATTKARDTDPHDRAMAEDYIPLSPGPLPSIPKLPKPSKTKKKPSRKPRPLPIDASIFQDHPHRHPEEAEDDDNNEEEAFLPSDLPPPTSPPHATQEESADPGIWNLGSNPSPHHHSSLHAAPAVRPGSVFCEPCFRDELARWVRLRDAVVGVLRLLGGERALAELRVLSQEVEAAENGERKGLLGRCEIEVVGAVLLSVMVGRLGQGKREEAERLVDGLRRDAGVGVRSLEALATVCKERLVRWRIARREEGRGEDGWWWQFDDTLLQAAERQLSATPSLFGNTLETKAREIPDATFTAREAATAQTRRPDKTPGPKPPTLAQLERILGLSTPTNLFLKLTGDKLALAKQSFPSQSPSEDTSPTTPSPLLNTNKKRPLPLSISSSPPPPTERLKSTSSTTSHYSSSILPCIHCSESTASHNHWARHNNNNNNNNSKSTPWLQPLLWTFGYTLSEALQVRHVEDWLAIVRAQKEVEVVDVLSSGGGQAEGGGEVVKVLVDGAGGRVRVVVVEMRAVWEAVLGEGRFVGGDGDGRKGRGEEVLGRARAVGRWERWRDGRLEGWRIL